MKNPLRFADVNKHLILLLMRDYTDNTVLDFGRYRFTRLSNIPPEYLLDLHKTRKTHYKKLLRYIDKNIKNIIDRKEGRMESPPSRKSHKVKGNPMGIICRDTEKRIYPSLKDAKYEIRRIGELKQENKKPVRAYECDKCGGWHLTSIELEDWKKDTGGPALNVQLLKPDYEKENEALKEKINQLIAEIRNLKDGNKQLKKNNKELARETGMDETLRALTEKIAEKNREIDKLKAANSTLILRMVQLQKKDEKKDSSLRATG